jgi:hypothetical protein
MEFLIQVHKLGIKKYDTINSPILDGKVSQNGLFPMKFLNTMQSLPLSTKTSSQKSTKTKLSKHCT